MAEVSSLFKISGRVGNTVFVQRNGKCYARSVALDVHNPNTLKQQLVRFRFRVAARFYQRFKDTLLGDVWRQCGRKAGLSGYTFFMRENLNAFDHQGKIADFDKLRLSVGNRQGVPCFSVSREDGCVVTLRWASGGEETCIVGNDRLMVVALYGDRQFSPEVLEDIRALRKDGVATFQLPRLGEVDVHLYCFFVSPTMEQVSDSQHLWL